jgi:hypothetical protein
MIVLPGMPAGATHFLTYEKKTVTLPRWRMVVRLSRRAAMTLAIETTGEST